MPLQVVWFKRDLRVTDHAPLCAAAERGTVLPLFVAEPSLLRAPDFDPCHWTFQRACLVELQQSLSRLGAPLRVATGEAVDVLEALRRLCSGEMEIWAHEETTNGVGYARDRAVRRWARAQGVLLHELPGSGVVRRLASRDTWEASFQERMAQRSLPPPKALQDTGLTFGMSEPPSWRDLGLLPDVRTGAQPGGIRAGWDLLDGFLNRRGHWYYRSLSSPNSAATACSRLSPHLAYGTITVRECLQATRYTAAAHEAQAGAEETAWRRSLQAFSARLRWRDHFIQKVETEPEIETRSLVRAMDGLRETEFDRSRFDAWREGRTGFPMIDASMRCLAATGWINFRMRAMLASFASFPLWLHWRLPALHLARCFVDYEPGIHYPQIQMQSGLTVYNTLRIYNPTRQALLQDPQGVFIRQWLPELAEVPMELLAEPWRMTRDQQIRYGCSIGRDYPAPVVAFPLALRAARAKLARVLAQPEVQAEAEQVWRRHGSRVPPMTPPTRRAPTPQLSLDLFGGL